MACNSLKDLTGQTFGYLTVVKRQGSSKSGNSRWLCNCVCGKETTVTSSHLKSGDTKSCGCRKKELLSGTNHHLWKGGKSKNPQGYIQVLCPDHPNSTSNGYILEHRLVMSIKLGRPLTKDENVHHINGNREDNRPENLELWVVSQPPGQRVEDKIQYAIKILRKYAPERLKNVT